MGGFCLSQRGTSGEPLFEWIEKYRETIHFNQVDRLKERDNKVLLLQFYFVPGETTGSRMFFEMCKFKVEADH